MNSSYHESIRSFAVAAESFCRLIERRGELEFDEFIFELDALLPQIYVAAHEMVATAPEDLLDLDIDTDEEELSFAELVRDTELGSVTNHLNSELKEVFGDEDQHYIGVNYTHPSSPDNPVDDHLPDTDVLFHSTSEELARAYESIRAALRYFREGDLENAGRDWLFGFYGAWGGCIPDLLSETFRLAHATISEDEAES